MKWKRKRARAGGKPGRSCDNTGCVIVYVVMRNRVYKFMQAVPYRFQPTPYSPSRNNRVENRTPGAVALFAVAEAHAEKRRLAG